MIRRTLAALALLVLASAPTPAHAAWQEDGTVVAILDHQTVVVRFPGTVGSTRIRLAGVEVSKGDECGRMAMLRFLDTTIVNRTVTVEFDRYGPLRAADGATRAWLWLGMYPDEELTVQELAGLYAEQICQPKRRI